MSRRFVVVAAALAALVAAGTVAAGNPTKEKIARTSAGNAQAKAEVVRRSDLGKGWSGGFRKPDLTTALPCSYRPKQSDLTVVGAAETIFDQPTAFEIDSEAQVLRTASMVKRDWQRTVLAPQVLPCLREALKKALGSGGKLTSASPVDFPRLATYTRAFRFLATVGTGSNSLPIESDFVALGNGRNEVSVTLTAFGKARGSMRGQELRLARLLARRMHS